MKGVLIVLNGPMTAGKSVIAETFMKRDGFFKASYDRVKWLISNYSTGNPEHRRIAREITFQTISGAMEQGLSVLIDGGHNEYRNRYQNIAQKYNFKYVSINIEAPYEILKQRFLERVAEAKKTDSPNISVTTIAGFDSRYNWYVNENKDKNAIATLDSSKLSLDEIVSEIDMLIQ